MDSADKSNNSERTGTSVQESISSPKIEAAAMSPSSDPVWRQVQSLVRELLEKNAEELSVGPHSSIEIVADIVKFAISSNLLPNVGNSSKRTRTSNPRTALLEHRRLVAGVEILLQFISTKNVLGRIVITSQLSNILAALIQLCYAPVRSVMASEAAIPITIQGWLEHGDKIDESAVSVDDVVAEMQRDRLRLEKRLQKLTETLFLPSVIESFLRMLSPSSPNWLKKTVSSHLSKQIVRENGLSSFLCAIGQVFDRDTPWLQLEKVAMLVTRPPSTIPDTDYTRNMGKQLKSILKQKISKSEMTLLVAIINNFLTLKPDLATEFVLRECFTDFVSLLRGDSGSELKIASEDVRRHFELVCFACDTLPKDSTLLEAFALFMPIHVSLATAAIQSDHQHVQAHLKTISKLASGLSDGVDVIIACLDPNDSRFRLLEHFLISFNDQGDVEFALAGNLLCSQVGALGVLFSKLFEVDEMLTCNVCLRLMDCYQSRDDEESGGNSEFWRVCLPLLMNLIELCKDTIQKNEEFTVRTIINNVSGIRVSESALEALKLVEVLLRSVNNLSMDSRRRLRASVRHLERVEGDLKPKALTLRNEILAQLVDVEPFRLEPRLMSWKYAPTALKLIANRAWGLDEKPALRKTSSDETGAQQPRRPHAKTVFGSMSDYLRVKDELMDPDVAIRGHGFIELRKLLAARDKQAGNDLDYLSELCKVALKEDDSYIYLGAVQCYALIVAWRTDEYLPDLLESFKTSGESDLKMKLTETLLRCVMSFGDMSPLYCEKIVTAIIECCEAEDIDASTKCAAASLLGQAVGYIPNRSSYFRRVVNILVCMITFEQDEVVRRAAASGLAKGLKSLDPSVLINDYPTEVRDVHRVVKGLYTKCEDEALKIHLQEILLILGEVAKTLIKTTART